MSSMGPHANRLRHSQQSLASTCSPHSAGLCSVGSVLILRGPDSQSAALTTNRSIPQVIQSKAFTRPGRKLGGGGSDGSPILATAPPLAFSASYSDILDTEPVKICFSPHVTNGYSRSASLLSNGQTILPVLQRAASKAAQMFQAGAYLHQYKAFGLEDDTFKASFLQIGQIISNYISLTPQ